MVATKVAALVASSGKRSAVQKVVQTAALMVDQWAGLRATLRAASRVAHWVPT